MDDDKTDCHPCSKLDRNNDGKYWCVVCRERLCLSCYEYHKILTVTKDHSLLTVEEFQSVSNVLSDWSIECSNHEYPIDHYCTSCKTPCCRKCSNRSHQKCALEMFTKEKKYNFEIDSMTKMEGILALTKNACSKNQQILAELENKRTLISENVQRKKQKIQQVLDSLDTIQCRFEEEYESKCREVRQHYEGFSALHDGVAKRMEGIKTFRNLNLSSIYFFLAERQLKEDIESFQKQCQNKEKSTKSSKFSTELYEKAISSELMSLKIITDPKSDNILGASVTTLDKLTDVERLDSKTLKGNKIHEFKLNSSFQLDDSDREYFFSCVTILRNGYLAVGERNNPRLLIYNKSGHRQSKLKLNHKPCSLAVVDSKILAITLNRFVSLVDTSKSDTLAFIKLIDLSDYCFGIVYFYNEFFVNCEHKGLKIVSRQGITKRTLCFITNELRLCIHKIKILVTCKQDSEMVHFFDLNSFERSISRCPGLFGATDVTSDNADNVYVSCDLSNKIYMLPHHSNDWIVALNHGINRPQSIVYDDTDGSLIVVNDCGKSICVYKKQ